MTWIQNHSISEGLAAEADVARMRGLRSRSQELYAEAARAEERAIAALSPQKTRTLGISAVSAVSLYYKAALFEEAERVACRWLANDHVPPFAMDQLRGLLQSIWSEQVRQRASIQFAPGQVLVSIRGGEVVEGGAPLDLILEKVQIVQAMFYRTAEFLKGLPHRMRGGPDKDLLSICRPWLFQAPPGSYQFAVAVEEQKQRYLFASEESSPREVADHFLRIVRASTEAPEQQLPQVVPDREYRNTFLKLARNLAPTGKQFSELEIRSADHSSGIVLSPYSRAAAGKAIQAARPQSPSEWQEPEEITGILRAAHLDKDWLEISKDGDRIRIERANDAIDDIVGPMMNRPVLVRVVRDAAGKRYFRDIEPG